MTVNKYTIHHYDLSADNLAIDLNKKGAHYCVFWYKSVPMGERYIYVHDSYSEKSFWIECVDAVWPTLEHYANGHGLKFIQQKPEQPDHSSIRLNCEIIVGKF